MVGCPFCGVHSSAAGSDPGRQAHDERRASRHRSAGFSVPERCRAGTIPGVSRYVLSRGPVGFKPGCFKADARSVIGHGGFGNTLGPRPENNRRRSPRLRCDNVQCGLGDVLDVSQSGIRVSRSTELPVKVGQEFAFELTVPEGKLLVLGKLIRTIKSRGRVHEYGIEWVKHDERLAAAVRAMARDVAYNETIRTDIERARQSE